MKKTQKKLMSLGIAFMMLITLLAGVAPVNVLATENDGVQLAIGEDGRSLEYDLGEYAGEKIICHISEEMTDFTGTHTHDELYCFANCEGIRAFHLEESLTEMQIPTPRVEMADVCVSLYVIEEITGGVSLTLIKQVTGTLNFEDPEYMEPFTDSEGVKNYPITYLRYMIYKYGTVVPTTGFIDTITEVPVGAKVYNDLNESYSIYMDSKEYHELGYGPFTQISIEPNQAVVLERIYDVTSGEGQVGTNLGWYLYEDGSCVCFFSPVAAEDIIPEGETVDVEQLRVDAVKQLIGELLAGLDATNETDLEALTQERLVAAGTPDVVEVTYDITKVDATELADGSIKGTIVITCGAKSATITVDITIEKLPHVHEYIWVVTKEATQTDEGEMEGVCTCGDKQTKIIPNLETSGDIVVEEDEENDYSGSLTDVDEVKGQVPLTEEEREAIFAGEDLKISLEVTDITAAEDINAEDKALVKESLDEKKLAVFIDVTLYKQIGDAGEKIAVPNTNGKVKITVVVPEEYREAAEGMSRTFSIIRVHEGEVDILEAVYDASTFKLTFETDAFSTYALTYADVAAAPDTGEVSMVGAWAVFMLSALGVVALGKKKF